MTNKKTHVRGKELLSKPKSKAAGTDIPRNAMHAAARGYDFRTGFASISDDFTGLSTMRRTGTVELYQPHGGAPIEVDFIAHVTFGKPRPAA